MRIIIMADSIVVYDVRGNVVATYTHRIDVRDPTDGNWHMFGYAQNRDAALETIRLALGDNHAVESHATDPMADEQKRTLN